MDVQEHRLQVKLVSDMEKVFPSRKPSEDGLSAD